MFCGSAAWDLGLLMSLVHGTKLNESWALLHVRNCVEKSLGLYPRVMELFE